LNILISNDDGILSDGIRVLAKTLAPRHNIIVVAPDSEKSASGHGITINKTIVLKPCNFDGITAYSLSGTPADCVKFGITYFSDIKFDMVIGGINRGSNTGTDVLYSGTVSCAAEAVALGVRGIAVSLTLRKNCDYVPAANFILENLEKLAKLELANSLLNINVPGSKIEGAVFTKLGLMVYNDRYVLQKGKKKKTFLLVGEEIEHNLNDADCDVEWVKKGFITLTPMVCSYTDFEKLKTLKGKDLKV